MPVYKNNMIIQPENDLKSSVNLKSDQEIFDIIKKKVKYSWRKFATDFGFLDENVVKWDSLNKHIVCLRIRDNSLDDEILDIITQLRKLEILDLHGNGIESLPRSFANFQNLKELNLSNNNLGILNDDSLSMLKHLKNLKRLYLHNNRFTKLPDALSYLSGLELLTIKHNKLDDLPLWYSKLKKISIVDLEGNKLTTVPDVLRYMKQATLIDLSKNDIHSLPEWFDELYNLKYLNLTGLVLDKIPHGVVKLGLPFSFNSFDGVILVSTRLTQMEISLFQKPQSIISSFYTTDTTMLRECKLILLGDGSVGKSSIVESMITGTCKKGKKSTDGVMIHKWKLKMESEESATIRILDFGGQEIMHAMHRCFLTNRTVYVVVCAGRDDSDIDKTADRWIENINAFASGCPIILVLNKIDENPHVSVNEYNLFKKYSNLVSPVIKTSAINGTGINDLISIIKQEIEKSDGYKTLFNASWNNVKTELESLEKNNIPYIDDEAYRKICNKNGIYDRFTQDEVLKWFKDLGITYYYSTNSLNTYLENLRVLTPKWITNGIYRLILRVHSETGILSHKEIKDTLCISNPNDVSPEIIYTPQQTEYILNVMRLFQISVKLCDDKELIPLKISKNPPQSINNFQKKDSLHLSWESEFIPNTVIHRLMIMMYGDLDLFNMWRSGACFKDDLHKSYALIEMTDEIIDLYVISVCKDSRREIYMEIIRSNILKIINDLNLKCNEMIHFCFNGEKGKLSYKHFNQLVCSNKEYINIEDVGDVPLSIIAEQNNFRKTIKEAHFMSENMTNNFVYGGQPNIQNATGSDIFQIQNVNATELSNKIAQSGPVDQSSFNELITFLKSIYDSGELRMNEGAKLHEILNESKDKPSATIWQKVRSYLGDAANLATLISVASTQAPQFIEFLNRVF